MNNNLQTVEQTEEEYSLLLRLTIAMEARMASTGGLKRSIFLHHLIAGPGLLRDASMPSPLALGAEMTKLII